MASYSSFYSKSHFLDSDEGSSPTDDLLPTTLLSTSLPNPMSSRSSSPSLLNKKRRTLSSNSLHSNNLNINSSSSHNGNDIGSSSSNNNGNGSTGSIHTHHHYQKQDSSSSGPQFHTCPTCNGIGRVFGEESELVALIPYSDQRLKPRRTKLWVSISIVATVISMALCVFFLFPREISMDVQVATTNYTVNGLDPVSLYIQHNITFRNSNYFHVPIEDIQIQVQFLDLVIGNYSIGYTSLGILDDLLSSVIVNASNIPDQYPYGLRVRNSCLFPDYKVTLQIFVTATANLIWQSQSIVSNMAARVVCGTDSNLTRLTIQSADKNSQPNANLEQDTKK